MEQPQLERQRSYTVLEGNEVLSRIGKLVEEAAEQLFLSPPEAACLLLKYQWNANNLKKEWFEDQNKVRVKAGVRKPDRSKAVPTGKVTCMMWGCDEVDVKDAFALTCGHWFCHGCWKDILTHAVSSGRNCVYSVCPAMVCKKDYCQHSVRRGCKCNEAIPPEMFQKFVTDFGLLEKYNRWLAESFVEGTTQIRWCPSPGCGHAVEYPPLHSIEVTCTCGMKFCFACSRVSHSPAPCDLVVLYSQQESSDDATQSLLLATTKECPSCKVRIMKNKACNHMTCAKCRHQFCWLCKGDWVAHGSSTGGVYVCKTYNANQKKGIFSEEEQQIREKQAFLQSATHTKYMFYRERFDHHRRAAEYAMKFIAEIEKQANADKYKKIEDAAKEVINCRRVLQWTFCIAYYLKPGCQKSLFEKWQELLNGLTEQLQDILEKNSAHPEQMLESKLLQSIGKLVRSVSDFRRKTVESCESPEFSELLGYKVEHEADAWYCTACQQNHKGLDKLKLTHCPNPVCLACRIHGEPACRVPGCLRD
eukprot:gb/GEZN01003089.1/.p1 GENE.gb/GEZN01003089.1/~~gb/GEZN01003089.1/.p1  ORF type:complete len:532 (+),score=62.37 gb/GEZN01003089.1/:275-1870(+)